MGRIDHVSPQQIDVPRTDLRLMRHWPRTDAPDTLSVRLDFISTLRSSYLRLSFAVPIYYAGRRKKTAQHGTRDVQLLEVQPQRQV